MVKSKSNDIAMDKRLLTGFVREVISHKDTPSLIVVLAENVRYLRLCRKIVNAFKLNNRKLFGPLRKVCFEHGTDLEWLENRLTPAAKALGLQVERGVQLDYYAILGINKDADFSKIKTAYRKKAYLTHPDTKGSDTVDNKEFIEINDAYQTLSDRVLRRHYDLSRQSLSKWSEKPVQILKAKHSRKIFAFQSISHLLILIAIVFLFDFIFHESNSLKGSIQPKSSEAFRDPIVQSLLENPPDLRLNKMVVESRISSKSIPEDENSTIGESEFQPDAFEVLPFDSKSDQNGDFNSGDVLDPTHSKPKTTLFTSIPPKRSQVDNTHLAAEKKKKIQIVFVENSKPDDSSSRDTVSDNKSQNNTKAKINHQRTRINSSQNFQEATKSLEDADIVVAEIQSTQAKTPDLIAKKTDHTQLAQVGIEKRLERFVDTYCKTYEEKNLAKFVNFFTLTAQENGKSFCNLLPKYNKNFSSIDKIKYQIKILKYSYDFNSGIVDFEGKFALKWLPKGDNWQSNFGKIAMRLVETNNSFLVEKLSYSGF